jgi:hypothetical protein
MAGDKTPATVLVVDGEAPIRQIERPVLEEAGGLLHGSIAAP